MAQHINISSGELYPQPEYTLSVDKEGKWTATQVFLCHRSSITSVMPRPGSQHPEISFLLLDSASAKVMEGDLAEITCNYAGTEYSSEGEDPAPAVYTMSLSLSEEPLLSNQRYKDLDDDEVEALSAIISGGVKAKDKDGDPYTGWIESPIALDALAKIKRGVTSYYCPKVVWRESITRNTGVSSADLNCLGKIDDPTGPVPDLATDRNWLLNGVTQTQEGGAFKVEREWLCSNPGGWDWDLYHWT